MQEAAITLVAVGSEQGRNVEMKDIPARLRLRSSEERVWLRQERGACGTCFCLPLW